VYAVCSTDAREGEGVIEPFLAAHPEIGRAPLPERYAPFATPAGDVLVPPGIDGRDGFFIAVMRRR
jgi:16S rRNA C967 or C1407 C5-methylase (RsmB/RsmF family)